MTNKSLTLFGLSLLLLLACPGAFAGKPQAHCFGYNDLMEVVDCGDFSVMDDAVIRANVKDYCDKEGNLTRSHVHLVAMDDFYRDDDPEGKHITGTAHLNDRAFYEGGFPLWTPAHIDVGVRISGLGLMFLDVGMLDIEPDGDWWVDFNLDRFSDWSPADFDALCAFFE